MKSFKVLVLGLVVGFVGIGSFSYAKTFTFAGQGLTYSPSTITIDVPLSSFDFSSIDYSCTSDNGWCYLYLDQQGHSCTIYKSPYNSSLVNNCGGMNMDGTFRLYARYETQPAFASISLNDGQFDIYDNGFTPAINGLHATVIELIPYVIYIGIGVLLFMLGFIAVRWLVNWISGKIKGIFISKRR